MNSLPCLFIFSILISISKCYVTWDNENRLHPVHGLYVKPSNDGTTGDLYVAATENDGVQSQWLTDQPVNFLTAASQVKSKSVPVSFTSRLTKTSSPNEETIVSKKRTVIKSPTVKYAYAVPGTEAMVPYPYPMRTKQSEEFSPCSNSFPVNPYSPYNYFYPYMMSALTNAMKTMKENEGSEETQNMIPQNPPPYWPHPYTYPYQYVMVDPSAWSQPQTDVSPTSTTTTSSAENA
ncbi:VMP25 protein [Danaus plexippus plexippus]|uniref:VMP25 protein n=1 Tax=Danaus plexippus plexippus TaxID=278856 RepID=A0A212F6N9_DANPL|nr:VMP25 protein [Danaus plexippus plexippus]